MAQTLTTNIVINATVGNGFSEIGNTLTVLGSQIDAISQRLIDFGKDSLKVYEDYEKSMSEAQIALSTIYGRDTKQLSDVMGKLDAQARDWASSTIFHTDDVANAITQAARAGWDYDQIMTGIPAAMQLAQAGSIDLSDSIYYITEAAKAGGIAFEDLGGFIDMWAFTANSSNGSIETFGDTMLKLGSVMQFAGSREELLSLIALMHDTGTEGSTAATLLRTAMMNILAPSGTAGKVLEQLGATDEEIRSIRQDASKLQALEILGEHGFSAFDDAGQAKPILTIFDELGTVLAEIAGGYENIDKNQTTLGILGTIFGKRGITGALNIINMMEHATDLEQQLLNGEASGYGAYAAETMMDTYYGAIETWESKVERLKQRTGETLAEQLEPLLETVGGIVEGLSEMDSGQFNALVAGMETLAFLGPGLLITGGAMRGIGSVLSILATPTGAVAISTIAAAAGVIGLMTVLDAFAEADYESKFGNLELDNSQVYSYVQGMKSAFDEANTSITTYESALTQAVEKYTTSSSELKSNLLTDMLTGTEIKEGTPEYTKLMGLGEDMIAAVNDGIMNNYASTMTSVTQLAGDDTSNPIWSQIIQVLDASLQQELGKAEELGKRLRKTLMDAITNDGHLSAEEMADIQSIMDEQNALLAMQVDREHYVQRANIMRKAQTLGLDAIRESSAIVEEERDREWNDLLDRQAGDMFDLMAAYDRAIANGTEIAQFALDEKGNYVLTGDNVKATEADKEMARAWMEQRQEQQRYEWTGRFSDFLIGLWSEGISSSELSDSWDALNALGQSYREAGGYVTPEAARAYNNSMGARELQQTSNYLNEMVDALGGYDVLEGYYVNFMKNGDLELAASYQRIMDMYRALGGIGNVMAEVGSSYGEGDYSESTGSYEQMAAMLSGTALTPEGLATRLQEYRGYGIEPGTDEWYSILGDERYHMMLRAANESGYRGITEWIESLGIPTIIQKPEEEPEPEPVEIEAESVQLNVNPEDVQLGNSAPETIARMQAGEGAGDLEVLRTLLDERRSNYETALGWDQAMREQYLPTYTQNYVQTGAEYLSAASGQQISVTYEGDTQMLESTLMAEDGAELMAYVNGDATDLHATIMDENGQVLEEIVTGDATQLESIISNYNGRRITLQLSGQRLFAEGGRATEASVFAEAGPEWAIPEEHSERTADLLDAARAASGFTWPELLARNGGLNANPGRAPMTLVYSPTIYAQDAEGVEDKLDADKARMEKWFAEKQMLDGVEVYA